jgi:hypothetical protein
VREAWQRQLQEDGDLTARIDAFFGGSLARQSGQAMLIDGDVGLLVGHEDFDTGLRRVIVGAHRSPLGDASS